MTQYTTYFRLYMPLSVPSTNEVRNSVQLSSFEYLVRKREKELREKVSAANLTEKTGEMNNSFHWKRWVVATDYYIIIRVDTTGVNDRCSCFDQHNRVFLLSFFRCIFLIFYLIYIYKRDIDTHTHTPTSVCVRLCLCCVISNT